MSRLRQSLGLGLLALPLLASTGCAVHASPSPGVKTVVGAGGGAAAGGLLASALSGGNPAITAAGALLGLLTGGAVGSALDSQDQRDARRAMQEAVTRPTGTTVPWKDAQTGTSGTITSGDWRVMPQGLCREYRLAVFMDGKVQEVVGCAIQNADGTWAVLQAH